jgi:6-pyruvoyltetrahydropterin/6-carboxytetrahydropterin synthase
LTATVTRRYHFSASHRLHVPSLSEAGNARLYGKCNNPFGHGHNYILSITVSGSVDPNTGLLLNRSELDELVSRQVLSLLAHRNLNLDVPQFAEIVPTTENIALVVTQILHRHWRHYITSGAARLARVHIQETDRNSVELRLPLKTTHIDRQERNESVIVHA